MAKKGKRQKPRKPTHAGTRAERKATPVNLREEYQYVIKDLQRIAIITVVIFVTMVTLALTLPK